MTDSFTASVPADHATGDEDVGEPLCSQSLDDLRHESQVGAREQRQPDGIGIFLYHGLHDLFRRLVQPGVDHLEACVP